MPKTIEIDIEEESYNRGYEDGIISQNISVHEALDILEKELNLSNASAENIYKIWKKRAETVMVLFIATNIFWIISLFIVNYFKSCS